jgi:mono/diheme cytochrome c family protein
MGEILMRNSLLLLALCCTSSVAMAQQPAKQPSSNDAAAVARGHYLVTVGGCNDCHSPKIMTAQGPVVDESRLLSGHPANQQLPKVPAGLLASGWGAVTTADETAWVGAWGTSFAANLTPDPTGLGNWTVDMFINSMRTGKYMGISRPILPPMPWAYYGQMSTRDLRAIFAYLRSLKPISNLVPEALPPAGSSR